MCPDRGGSFDEFAHRVRRALGVPMAMVTVVEQDRQEYVGAVGVSPDVHVPRTPLSHSFCQFVVRDRDNLVVRDARVDERVRDNPAIQRLGVVAYAGSPLIRLEDGEVVGALCAIDHEPRAWTTREMIRLAELARDCSRALGAGIPRQRDDGATDGVPPVDPSA